MSYEEYRKNKIESGLLYQDFVVDCLFQILGLAVVQYTSKFYQMTIGESRTGVEIKHDEQYVKTGNLWIEKAEKAVPRPGAYAPSGIYRDDNTWLYVIGNYDVIFGFAKKLLQILSQSPKYRHLPNKTGTSEGFLLPDTPARQYAAFILTPQAEQKIAKAITDLQDLGRALHEAVLTNPAQRSLFDELT